MSDKEKEFTPEEVDNIFTKQLEKFKLDEEGEAFIKKMGWEDKDFSMIDFDVDDEVNYSLIDEYTLTDAIKMGSEYQEEVTVVVEDALKDTVRSIESNRLTIASFDRNEKLLAMAKGLNLMNAVSYMGYQMNEAFDENIEPLGTTADELYYASNLIDLLKDYANADISTQTTMACEMPFIKNECDCMLGMSLYMHDINERINAVMQRKSEWIGKVDFEDALDESLNLVNQYYTYMEQVFSGVHKQLKDFVDGYNAGKIVLNESGNYNPKLSVFITAKKNTFEDENYFLPSDDVRICMDKDVEDSMSDFLANKKYKDDQFKRNAMAITCFEKLCTNNDKKINVIEYCEKLMLLDEKNQYSRAIMSHVREYTKCNLDSNGYTGNVYSGYFGSQLKKAKAKHSEQMKRSIKWPELIIGIICAIFTVAALIAPLTLVESIFESVMKVVYVILAIVFIIATGPGVIIMLPLCYFGINMVLGFIDIFINPVLFVKLLVALICGYIAWYTLFGENDLINILKGNKVVNVEKNESLPIAEKLLLHAKSRNFPLDIVKYYENMVADFKNF